MDNLSKQIRPIKERPIRIVQFGEGNFLRAFVDWIVQHMNDENVFDGNVAVVQPLPMGRVKELSQQDGLYTLVLNGIEKGTVVDSHEIIDVLSAFNDPYLDYQGFLGLAEIDALRFVVSNSTEAGIVYHAEDFASSSTPVSFPCKVLALLKRRYDAFDGAIDKGLIFFPCELIDDNGSKLKEVVMRLATDYHFDPAFIAWLQTANRFCNTLVDRIVPGYPRNEADAYQEAWGYTDNSIVKAEIFHLWVIEADETVRREFPADAAGLNVKFVADHHPYKERKVKILNGAHTCMVPVAYLAGFDTVREAIEDPTIRKFVLEFLDNEVLPTIDLPKDEIAIFTRSVLERFANPFVRHELMSISLNSMTKFKTRILPSVIELDAQGKFASHAWFSLAALIVFYRGGRNGKVIDLKDDEVWMTYWKSQWNAIETKQNTIEEVVRHFLTKKDHWESDVPAKDEVIAFVSKAVSEITKTSIAEAMKSCLAGD
ncbi:MAG: tagaturonate reductase [Erysipelotrichaceae bacterium]